MKLTSSSSAKKGILAQNTFINLIGKAIPLLPAVIAIPFLIKGLGTPRFGVLMLVWSIIGYFGLLDMGVGRATTKFVADQEAAGKTLLPIIVTSITLLIGIGIAGGVIIFFATPWIVNDILNVPAPLAAETQTAFYILSASIPVILGCVGASGILQAQQRFKLINAVKVPANILNSVSPLIVLIFTKKLPYIVAVLVVERAITFIIYIFYCLKGQPLTLNSDYSFEKWTKKLLGFGAWLTVSNIVNSIMVYMDRFIIGAILTMSAVAYYTTPYEVVKRISVISGSFMGVMFPAFSVYFLYDQEKFIQIYQESFRYILCIITPIVTVFLLGSHAILTIWLGDEFAEHSTIVLQILAVAIFINSITKISGSLVQAAGRPDLRAKLHIAELPVYLVLLWYFTHWLGLEGVALAWLIRVSVDGLVLFYFGHRLTFYSISWKKLFVKTAFIILAVAVSLIIMHWWLNNPIIALFYALFWGILIFFVAWRYILQSKQRNKIRNLLDETRTKMLVPLRKFSKK
jgi:O-antigen/teichoic acid export membrane protein